MSALPIGASPDGKSGQVSGISNVSDKEACDVEAIGNLLRFRVSARLAEYTVNFANGPKSLQRLDPVSNVPVLVTSDLNSLFSKNTNTGTTLYIFNLPKS